LTQEFSIASPTCKIKYKTRLSNTNTLLINAIFLARNNDWLFHKSQSCHL